MDQSKIIHIYKRTRIPTPWLHAHAQAQAHSHTYNHIQMPIATAASINKRDEICVLLWKEKVKYVPVLLLWKLVALLYWYGPFICVCEKLDTLFLVPVFVTIHQESLRLQPICVPTYAILSKLLKIWIANWKIVHKFQPFNGFMWKFPNWMRHFRRTVVHPITFLTLKILNGVAVAMCSNNQSKKTIFSLLGCLVPDENLKSQQKRSVVSRDWIEETWYTMNSIV